MRRQRPDQLQVQTAPLCIVKTHPEDLAVPDSKDQAEAGLVEHQSHRRTFSDTS